MSKIVRIFWEELKLLRSNVITALLLIGVLILPCVFTGYNVLSCWDAFNNTGNLSVAVANSDEGYQSELMPVKVNVGESVVSALRENKKLNWVFVDEEEAISGTESGKYYAAVVIPEDFSQSMLTFYQDDAKQAELVFYCNEKLNAITPKVTTQGANTISSTVNTTFAESVSGVALTLADSLSEYLESDEAASTISNLATTAGRLGDRADQAADLLDLYAKLAGSAKTVTGDTSAFLTSSNQTVGQAADAVEEGSDAASSTATGLQQAFNSLSTAMDTVIDNVAAIAEGELEGSDGSAAALAEAAAARKAEVEDAIDAYTAARDALEEYGADASVIDSMDTALASLESLRDNLEDLVNQAEAGEYSEDGAALASRAKEAAEALKALKDKYNNELQGQLSDLSDNAATLLAVASAVKSESGSATSTLTASLADAGTTLGEMQQKLAGMATSTREFATEMHELSTGLTDALASNDMDAVRQFLSPGVETLASALSKPVEVNRVAVYASENFGSSMFPLYGALGLFVGSVLIMLLMSPRVSPRALRAFGEDNKPSARQQMVGHFGIVAVVSLAQSTLLGLVALLLIGVQAEHPLLVMLCLWVSGLVFVFIMYALINMFSSAGKAIGVLLLVIQVTGSGGSFPLVILPSFVQNISAYLPAYHIVNTLRAAMFGIYQNDYWWSLGKVALFAVPIFILLVAATPAFNAFTSWYSKQAEKSKLLG